MTVAKHLYTYEEVHARKQDVRSMFVQLRAMEYGGTRKEAQDLHNLSLELGELRQWLNTEDRVNPRAYGLPA